MMAVPNHSNPRITMRYLGITDAEVNGILLCNVGHDKATLTTSNLKNINCFDSIYPGGVYHKLGHPKDTTISCACP